ncbi:helix-turn-helix domain-containing protein [Aeromicrobium sp.]|uniref:helix-turn-helix domain-containing protein n=1 Tax=Aeromicrobium sp. TaxID=1871063 RepID=UPI0039E28075
MSENIATILFRLHWSQRDLAISTGINRSTLSRKMGGAGEWSLSEVEDIAAATFVTPNELIGDLPSYEVWAARMTEAPAGVAGASAVLPQRARRDSNPKPSDP